MKATEMGLFVMNEVESLLLPSVGLLQHPICHSNHSIDWQGRRFDEQPLFW